MNNQEMKELISTAKEDITAIDRYLGMIDPEEKQEIVNDLFEFACALENKEILLRIIGQGVDGNFDDINNLAVYLILAGHISKIKDKGYNKKQLNIILNEAVYYNESDVVEYLLDNFDINLSNEYTLRNMNPFRVIDLDKTDIKIVQKLIKSDIPPQKNNFILYDFMKRYNMLENQTRPDIIDYIKEAGRIESERLETERIEAERIESERLEAERIERRRLEQERLNEERNFKAKDIIFRCLNDIICNTTDIAISFSNLQEYIDLISKTDLSEFQKQKLNCLKGFYKEDTGIFLEKILEQITTDKFSDEVLDLGNLSILFEDTERADQMFCELLELYKDATSDYHHIDDLEIIKYREIIKDEENQQKYRNQAFIEQKQLVKVLHREVHDLRSTVETSTEQIKELQDLNRDLSERISEIEKQNSVGSFTQQLDREKNNKSSYYCNIL